MYSHVASKNKFHVVCCLDPKPLAFFINSELAPFVQSNLKLVACNAVIKDCDHDFLSRDSYVACCEAVSLVGVEPGHYEIIGHISDGSKQGIIDAVRDSPVLVLRQKEWILKALSG